MQAPKTDLTYSSSRRFAMGEEVFHRQPTSQSTIRTIVYLPKEDVVKTMKLLTNPSTSRSSHEITTFFKPITVTTAPNSPSSLHPESSSTSSSTPPYRFASIERLVQRQKIYDSSTLPVVAHFDDSPLSQKREMFFRDNTTPPPSTANVLPNVPASFAPNVNNFTPAAPLYNSNNKENTSTTTFAKETPVRDMDGYVGFANLPNQIYRKAVKKGFEFTLMIVGEAGLGKSTLINSMFLTDIYSNEYPGPSLRPKKTTQVETTKVLLKENGVNLQLTVVDTPGFGDAVDNSECWQPIIDFIENRYEEFLNGESRVHRSFEPDGRVHCCLYFIAPSGHGLKPLDVEFMKRLHDKVNIIPVLAKADTMTPEECAVFKRTILNEVARNKIKIYDFPDSGEDEEENKMLKRLKDRVPFAVVGSNTVIEVNGKRLRGRKYPWGIAEVENMEHCDFIALRNMLIRTHMQDLKDVTNNVHYENYRCKKLAAFTNDGKPVRISNKNPLAQMEEEKKEHEQKMKKMEQEREQLFEQKVKEKFQKLADSEADLERRNEQMKKSLEAQRKELEDKRKVFEEEKRNFEALNDEEAVRRASVDVNMKDQDTKEKKKEKKKGLF